MKTVIAVNGACGRMGQRIVQLAHEDRELVVGAALDAPGHPQQGRDAGEVAGIGKISVPVQPFVSVETRLDVIIDFSMPDGTMAILPVALERKIPIVIATTGHT